MDFRTTAQQLFFSTIRIQTTTTTSSGLSSGTAFVFNYEWDGKSSLFLVTNKHVVANSVTGKFFFTLRDGEKPLVGKRFHVLIDNFEQQWHGHPQDGIDIAVMPIVPVIDKIQQQGKSVFLKAISHKLIPTPEQLNELDAIEEIVFIGYPDGIFDTTNLQRI